MHVCCYHWLCEPSLKLLSNTVVRPFTRLNLAYCPVTDFSLFKLGRAESQYAGPFVEAVYLTQFREVSWFMLQLLFLPSFLSLSSVPCAIYTHHLNARNFFYKARYGFICHALDTKCSKHSCWIIFGLPAHKKWPGYLLLTMNALL